MGRAFRKFNKPAEKLQFMRQTRYVEQMPLWMGAQSGSSVSQKLLKDPFNGLCLPGSLAIFKKKKLPTLCKGIQSLSEQKCLCNTDKNIFHNVLN